MCDDEDSSKNVTNPTLRRRDAVSGGALILMVGKHVELAMRDHAEKQNWRTSLVARLTRYGTLDSPYIRTPPFYVLLSTSTSPSSRISSRPIALTSKYAYSNYKESSKERHNESIQYRLACTGTARRRAAWRPLRGRPCEWRHSRRSDVPVTLDYTLYMAYTAVTEFLMPF